MKKYLICAVLGLSMLSGCASTLNKSFATGYGLNKVSREINTELLDTGKIDYATGVKVRKVEDEALAGLDAAWKVRLVSADATKTTVNKVNATLIETLNMLEKYQGKK